MNQVLADRTGMALSLGCLAHCLLLPVLIPIFPLLTTMAGEGVHRGFAISATAIGLLSFGSGYRKHSKSGVLALGLIGLSFLIFALYAESLEGTLASVLPRLSPFGEALSYETVFTCIGGAALLTAHLSNLHYCKCSPSDEECGCRNPS